MSQHLPLRRNPGWRASNARATHGDAACRKHSCKAANTWRRRGHTRATQSHTEPPKSRGALQSPGQSRAPPGEHGPATSLGHDAASGNRPRLQRCRESCKMAVLKPSTRRCGAWKIALKAVGRHGNFAKCIFSSSACHETHPERQSPARPAGGNLHDIFTPHLPGCAAYRGGDTIAHSPPERRVSAKWPTKWPDQLGATGSSMRRGLSSIHAISNAPVQSPQGGF